MASYCFINSDNVVVEVISGIDEDDLDSLPEEFDSWEDFYGSLREDLTCLRTSYNTLGNQHLNGGTAYRGNYAMIGGTFDSDNDVFIPKQPEAEGWTYTLNSTSYLWEGTEDES